MTDRTGQQLGNYRLLRLLGRGGFATVYLGEHIYLNTLAAIKVLDARLSSEGVDQFREEARTIAHLEHPHIVRVLDFGVEEAFHRTMRITFAIRLGMMLGMRGGPLQCGAFQRHRAKHKQQKLDDGVWAETAMGQHPMEADRHAHRGDGIHPQE